MISKGESKQTHMTSHLQTHSRENMLFRKERSICNLEAYTMPELPCFFYVDTIVKWPRYDNMNANS